MKFEEKEFYVYGKVRRKIEAVKIKGFTDGRYNYYQVGSGAWVSQLPLTGELISISDTIEETAKKANSSGLANTTPSVSLVRKFQEDIRKAERRIQTNTAARGV